MAMAVLPAVILTAVVEGGKARRTASAGTRRLAGLFGGEEVAMITGIIKALLRPALLVLGVAMLIRMMKGRRAH